MSEKRVLAVVAHPDDEVLMCGATLARHIANGDAVKVIIVAQGVTSRDFSKEEKIISALINEAIQANRALGIDDVEFFGLPDQRLDSGPLLDGPRKIEEAIESFQPSVVYTHHGGDLNLDHRIVHQAVLTAARPVPNSPVKIIYAGEVLSSTEWSTPSTAAPFMPNYYMEITDFMDKKLAAIDKYKSEMRAFPHPRSIEAVSAQAVLRGSAVGVHKAEAFMILRQLQQ